MVTEPCETDEVVTEDYHLTSHHNNPTVGFSAKDQKNGGSIEDDNCEGQSEGG